MTPLIILKKNYSLVMATNINKITNVHNKLNLDLYWKNRTSAPSELKPCLSIISLIFIDIIGCRAKEIIWLGFFGEGITWTQGNK